MTTLQPETFEFRHITSPGVMEEVYRLRYQVYCNECHFIDPKDYPDGIETDGYDRHSVHFGAYDLEGRLVGSVRLILPSSRKFPIEEHCPTLDVDPLKVSPRKSAEISRLTISKLYRRRAQDGLYYEPQAQDVAVRDKGQYFMRRVRPMAFGLYREMYHESKRLGIRYWYALMEKTLRTLLKIHGFVFDPIGPEVDFYGLVTPYLADIVELEKNVHEKFPQFYDYFMEHLEPQLQPKL